MNAARLVQRSLQHHWRTHLGVLLGSAVAAAVLIGALVVGDSVRQSLLEMARLRLGRVELAVWTPERFFRAELARQMIERGGGRSSAVLQLPGVAAPSSGDARANRVQVLGIDDNFWAMSLAPGGAPAMPTAEGVILNHALARHLGLKVGDTLVLRVSKPGTLPRDMPLASEEDSVAARRLTVQAIAGDELLGSFSLRAQQVPPLNAIVNQSALQSWVDLPGRANLLLLGDTTPERATSLLAELWTPADAEVELRTLAGGERELRSRRVFVDDAIAAAAPPGATRVLTYFVNGIETDAASTPYSMVAAVGFEERTENALSRLAPPQDDLIVLNQWAADDLKVKQGHTVRLRYYVVGLDGRLREESRPFRVHAVVPLAGAAADPTLMPQFPGIADSNHCREWEPGIPIDLQRIRDKDEKYWDDHRGTPKAFITLAAGQAMWGNRFGSLTALRYPAKQAAELESALATAIRPEHSGATVQDVRAQARAASTGGIDFGQLFLGLSFFLIVAALILTGLLFVFGIEQRAREVGALLAVGLRRSLVRRLLIGEGLILAVLGSLLGAGLGLLYTRAMLRGLATVWQDAVAAASLRFHVEPTTLVIGVAASVAMALLAMAWPLRKLSRMPAAALLSGGAAALTPPLREARPRWAMALSIVGLLGAVVLLPMGAGRSGAEAAAVFFGVGSLLLLGGLGAARLMLRRMARGGAMTMTNLGLRHAVRRPGRSLATISLLACGCFLVLAVSANRQSPLRDADQPTSGTGGFALLGESALPVLQDLNSADGRDVWGLSERDMAGVRVLPLRLREGDDASCLNLNRAQTPRLLGIPVRGLEGRFRFARGNGWHLLEDASGEEHVVPGVADQATAMWALGKGMGGTIDFIDEFGRPFRVRLVGLLADTILQGHVMISEQALLERYPSTAGRRVFLVDAPADGVGAASKALSRAMQDVGLELTPTVRRLGQLMAVQNTYLAIFGVLGGLGVLLGSAGLAMVVLRNVLERRGELAAMSAVGLTRRQVRRVVLAEHALLLGLGLAVGVVAAGAAIWPTIRGPGAADALGFAALVVAALVLSGGFWVTLATRLAVRGRMIDALRQE